MKTTNIRVRRNFSKNTAIPQVPNKPDESPRNVVNRDRAEETASLIFYHHCVPEAALNYTDTEFAGIQQAARNAGQTLNQFLVVAIKDKLDKQRGSDGDGAIKQLAAELCQVNLELAVDEAEALAVLFREHIEQPEAGGWNESINNGFVLLSTSAFDKLRAEVAKVDKIGERLRAVVGGGEVQAGVKGEML